MDDLRLSINLISKDPKDESVINKIKEEIDNIVKEKYKDIVAFTSFVNHKSSNTTTPDGQFKIGCIYKLKEETTKREIYVLLYSLFKNNNGTYHILFCPSMINNPSMLEEYMGFTNPENYRLVDEYQISINTLGYYYEDGKIFSYIRHEEVEIEFIKELDHDEFFKFYLEMYNKENNYNKEK